MKKPQISVNINLSLVLSVLLHGGIFVLALGMAAPAQEPLPVGVELMYGEGGSIVAPKPDAPVKAPKIKASVVADDSEGPAIKTEKVTETATVSPPVPDGKTAGSLAGTSDKGALEGREGVANGIEVSPEQRYLYEIKKLLERRKRYPVMARKMGQTGRVMMRFTLAQDGSLVASEVLEKAPYEILNQAAHDLVKGIHGMKPFPHEIQRTSWSITVPIEYVLN